MYNFLKICHDQTTCFILAIKNMHLNINQILLAKINN